MRTRSFFLAGVFLLVQGSMACSLISSDGDDRRYRSSDDDDDDTTSSSGRSASSGSSGKSASSGGSSSSGSSSGGRSSSSSSSGQAGSSSSSGSEPFDVTVTGMSISPDTGIVATSAPHVATYQINGNVPASAGLYFSPVDPLPANVTEAQLTSAVVLGESTDTTVAFTFTPPAAGVYTFAVLVDGDGNTNTTDDVVFDSATITVP
ncbi:MAG: hypothetical protein EOP08_00960 [Proteobacteria bacterium]|nr:MAG: hypothetical protein EOP08_00960 [Pseudomonadota bacterium]